MEKQFKVLTATLLLALVGILLPSVGSAALAKQSQQSGTHGVSSALTAKCGLAHKAGVVLKLGAAVGLFHRYLYTPWKAGKFKKGGASRKSTIIKAAGATLVGVLAARSALRSMEKCGAGSRIASKLDDAKARLGLLKSGGGGTGSVDPQMGSLNSDFSTVDALKSNP